MQANYTTKPKRRTTPKTTQAPAINRNMLVAERVQSQANVAMASKYNMDADELFAGKRR